MRATKQVPPEKRAQNHAFFQGGEKHLVSTKLPFDRKRWEAINNRLLNRGPSVFNSITELSVEAFYDFLRQRDFGVVEVLIAEDKYLTKFLSNLDKISAILGPRTQATLVFLLEYLVQEGIKLDLMHEDRDRIQFGKDLDTAIHKSLLTLVKRFDLKHVLALDEPLQSFAIRSLSLFFTHSCYHAERQRSIELFLTEEQQQQLFLGLVSSSESRGKVLLGLILTDALLRQYVKQQNLLQLEPSDEKSQEIQRLEKNSTSALERLLEVFLQSDDPHVLWMTRCVLANYLRLNPTEAVKLAHVEGFIEKMFESFLESPSVEDHGDLITLVIFYTPSEQIRHLFEQKLHVYWKIAVGGYKRQAAEWVRMLATLLDPDDPLYKEFTSYLHVLSIDVTHSVRCSFDKRKNPSTKKETSGIEEHILQNFKNHMAIREAESCKLPENIFFFCVEHEHRKDDELLFRKKVMHDCIKICQDSQDSAMLIPSIRDAQKKEVDCWIKQQQEEAERQQVNEEKKKQQIYHLEDDAQKAAIVCDQPQKKKHKKRKNKKNRKK